MLIDDEKQLIIELLEGDKKAFSLLAGILSFSNALHE